MNKDEIINEGRKIRLAKMPTDHWRKCQRTIGENAKENNTSINNTSINKKEIYKEKAYAYLKRQSQ